MMDWNRRLSQVLHRTSIVEVGLIASRDVQAALDYESRLQDYEIQIQKEKATCCEQMAK